MNREIKEEHLLRSLHFFKNLSKEDADIITDSSTIAKFKKGELIQSKDKLCTGVVVVIDGVVRSFMSSSSGREITLFRLFEYDVCMLSSACDYKNLQFDINVEAEDDSTVIIIDSKSFKKLSDKNPFVQKYMLELVQGKLSDVLMTLEKVVFFSMENRISSHLLDLHYSSEASNIKTTHEKIANNLGSAREVVSRILKKFEKEEIVINKRGCIEILDVHKLKLKSV